MSMLGETKNKNYCLSHEITRHNNKQSFNLIFPYKTSEFQRKYDPVMNIIISKMRLL